MPSKKLSLYIDVRMCREYLRYLSDETGLVATPQTAKRYKPATVFNISLLGFLRLLQDRMALYRNIPAIQPFHRLAVRPAGFYPLHMLFIQSFTTVLGSLHASVVNLFL